MWQLCLAVAVMLLLAVWANDHGTFRYVCPQCGSTDGEHAEGCSWKD